MIERFKEFIVENEEILTNLSGIGDLEKWKSTKNSITYKVKVDDRQSALDKTLSIVSSATSAMTSLSSFPIAKFNSDGIEYRIVFKPKSGGMTETTLNSTITELIPCLIWIYNISEKKPEDLYKKIIGLGKDKILSSSCFLNQKDALSGYNFIEKMETSSKFKEKMENAIGVYKFLKDFNSKEGISKVYWTYRAKPEGVPSNSPADIILKLKNGNLFGVSLKAGGKKTKEPLLNTYVKPILKFFNARIKPLQKELDSKVYAVLGMPGSKDHRQTKRMLIDLEKSDSKKYNLFYDKGLDIIRKYLTNIMGKNLNDFIDFAKEKILKKSDSVPVDIVKAVGDSYKLVKDADELERLLSLVDSMTIKMSNKSKQNFSVFLNDQGKKSELLFSVRSNKSGSDHKLGQFFNLAVKYNGLK